MLRVDAGRRDKAPRGRSPRLDPRTSSYVPSNDPATQNIEAQALQVAATEETVLLLGETGVGKDRLAGNIHKASPRADRRFVPINCAALPDGLLESELFGHVRGAYTGAVDTQPGQLEMAAGGTLFLDEIGELSPRLQAKLLHVLQEKRFCRVGGRESIKIDARFIAATNQDLDQAMTVGNFRRDLYYRLCVVSLRLPPLRERSCDIETLARFFALKYSAAFNRPELAEVSESTVAALLQHPFPGNVRELENIIKRAILLGGYEMIFHEVGRSFQTAVKPVTPQASAVAGAVSPLKEVSRKAVEEAERTAILRALSLTRWNRRRAARLLEVSYRSLLYKIGSYAINPASSDPGDVDNQPIIGPEKGHA